MLRRPLAPFNILCNQNHFIFLSLNLDLVIQISLHVWPFADLRVIKKASALWRNGRKTENERADQNWWLEPPWSIFFCLPLRLQWSIETSAMQTERHVKQRSCCALLFIQIRSEPMPVAAFLLLLFLSNNRALPTRQETSTAHTRMLYRVCAGIVKYLHTSQQ